MHCHILYKNHKQKQTKTNKNTFFLWDVNVLTLVGSRGIN
jgi:hypothetical protein